MNYINVPTETPENVTHRTFFSKLYNHIIGYNIYLPPDYEECSDTYPVAYHLHGWTGSESTEIWPLERIYKSRRAITVFPNSSPVIEDVENLPVESMLINELIPYIDEEYRTDTVLVKKSISGFSMGGAMAFYCAVKYPEIFGSVTAYAGTYHHFFHKGSRTVDVAVEEAAWILEGMLREERDLEENNILCLVRQKADQIRSGLQIKIHVGTNDILSCDNEIMHQYLDSLKIPHEYRKFDGVAHVLDRIIE